MKCKSGSTASPISSATGSRPRDGDGPVEWFSIGEVVTLVGQRFPGVSASKIRYLETRGLLTPARTSGGTRRYARSDVDLIERILQMQTRDFLPLDVIAERLSVDPASFPGSGEPHSSHLTRAPTPEMDMESFLHRTGLTNAMLVDCEDQGLISRRDTHGVAIGRFVVQLSAYGLEPRHLRSLRLSASRIIDLVDATTVGPSVRPSESSQAAGARQEVLDQLLHLHAALIVAALRE